MSVSDRALLAALEGLSQEQIAWALSAMSPEACRLALALLGGGDETKSIASPLAQAQMLERTYIARAHLTYLSERLAQAVADVEAGRDRRIIVSLPPRHGKSHMSSIYFPTWLLHRHPDWKLMLVSHSPTLAESWGRKVRRIIERHGDQLGISIAPDAKAVKRWETTAGGVMRSLSIGQSPTGEGAKVLLVDDPVRDFATAHSEGARESLWNFWQADLMLRLEPPSLVVVTMTRWHESDLVGRILSRDYPGDPDDWEVIKVPAIAHAGDILGRAKGEPLLSPLLAEDTPQRALARLAEQRAGMTAYQWSALFDQEPAPASGAIFNTDNWRYWTSDPGRATEDGRVVYLDPSELRSARVITSWDFTFKSTKSSDWVVGQRWARIGPDRLLLDQVRGKWDFVESVRQVEDFMVTGLGAEFAHTHLIEDKANGPAIMSTLRKKISGLKPVEPYGSKEARARAVSPEIESGNVRLPLDEPWVSELVEEARTFPTGRHDDMVDTMTQALDELREGGPVTMHTASMRPRGARLPSSFSAAIRGR